MYKNGVNTGFDCVWIVKTCASPWYSKLGASSMGRTSKAKIVPHWLANDHLAYIYAIHIYICNSCIHIWMIVAVLLQPPVPDCVSTCDAASNKLQTLYIFGGAIWKASFTHFMSSVHAFSDGMLNFGLEFNPGNLKFVAGIGCQSKLEACVNAQTTTLASVICSALPNY